MNIIEIYNTKRFNLPDIFWYRICEFIFNKNNPIDKESLIPYVYQFRNEVYNNLCRHCVASINTKEHKVTKNKICNNCNKLNEYKCLNMYIAKLKYNITDEELATLYCGFIEVYNLNKCDLLYYFLEKDIINLVEKKKKNILNQKSECELLNKNKICINLIIKISDLILKVYTTNTDVISSYCTNADIISWNNAHHLFIKLNKNKYGDLAIIQDALNNKIDRKNINDVLKIYDKSEIKYRINTYQYSSYNHNSVLIDQIYSYYNMKPNCRKKLLIEFLNKNKIEYKKNNALCSNYINGYCCKSINEIGALTKLSNTLFIIGYRYWLQNKLQYENILKDRVLHTGVKWMDAVDILIEEKIYLSRLYLG